MASVPKLRPAVAVLAALALALAAVAASGCGSAAGGSGPATGGTAGAASAPGSATSESPAASGFEAAEVASDARASRRTGAQVSTAAERQRLRDAIIRGEARDYAEGTRAGGPAFQVCFRSALRSALDPAALARLVQVYRRPYGQQYAAQALTILAGAPAASCGHPHLVGEMVDASRALRTGRLTGAAARELGVTYGPYLGVRCRRAGRIGCDRVGIDIVLKHAATSVVAVIGDRRLRLHTPGMHDGVRRHDWVGTLDGAGMDTKDSPLFIADTQGPGRWAGYPPVYVPVEFRVAYAGGHRARALFAKVFLSPGWG